MTPPLHSLNPRLQGLLPSATLAINERSATQQREGKRIFRLGLGQSPFPVPRPVVEALQQSAHAKDYLPVKGLAELRAAVAAYHARAEGIGYEARDVMVGPGSKELLFLLQLVYWADLVIPSPSWVSYAPQARIVGRPVHWLHTTADRDWCLTPEELDRHCRQAADRPRLIVLNYPSNPTGGSFPIEALEALAAVARRYGMLVLSDEIYGPLRHDGQHVSIARFYPEGTIIAGGLSKWCGAGGWRLGTFTFPGELRWLLDAMAVVASETFTSTSAPIQWAAVRAYAVDSELDAYVANSRRILQALGARLWAILRGAGLACLPPGGAFYLFPDFESRRGQLQSRGIEDSRTLCERLLADTGVAVLPGADFGRPAAELTLRLAYVNFDGAAVLAAAQETATLNDAFLDRYCGDAIEAVARIADWAARS